MERGGIRRGPTERTRPARLGDSARLPFIIIIFLVRGKKCLLKINPHCPWSSTKLRESVPLRGEVYWDFPSSGDRQIWLCQ